MSDLSCSFMDFRSLTAKYNLQLFLKPSNHYYSSALVYDHNSRLNCRIKRSPLRLNLISNSSSSIPSSSELDLISTHKHSDGSLLFRFGDPSEVAKNVEMEESQTVKNVETEESETVEEIEKEVKEGYRVVKVLDGDYESKVTVNKLYGEVKNEDTISIEELFEDSNEIESTETELLEDSSPVNASVIDEGSEIEDSIVMEQVPEMETADVDTLVIKSRGPGLVSDSENQNDENEMQNEFTEDGLKSDSLSIAPQTEPSKGLSEEMQAQSGVIIGDDSEKDTNDIVAIEIETSESGTGNKDELVEDDNGSDNEETGNGVVEKSRVIDGSKNLTMHQNMPQGSILQSEITKDDQKEQSSDHEQVSLYEATEPKSIESSTNRQEVLTDNFVLLSGAATLPHPSKTGGEDAYFVVGQTWLGVADGVGEWSLEGTSPGVHARELMKNCESLVSDCNGYSINDPLELLKLGVAKTHSPGSSAVLVAQFDGQALHVANIGDSGFIVLRHGTVYKRSSPTVHGFHFPLQIKKGEDPSHLAELYKVDLEEDDVIIIATDGVFDNLYDQEISSTVLKSLTADTKLVEIAVLLATKAQEIGKSTSGRSPFADNAQAAGCVGCTGGKLDDVAVIVSVVRNKFNYKNL